MSKVKLIIFDLDGVLLKTYTTKHLMMHCFLWVMNILSVGMNIYLPSDGLKTTQKLEMLSEKRITN